MLRALALALAALPPAHPPDVDALKKQGVAVTWPLTRSVRLPSAYPHDLGVAVRAKRRVTISLRRVDARGRLVETVKRQTVREGTFDEYVYGKPGARFQLRLEVGKQRFWSWITLVDSPRIACERGTSVEPGVAVEPTLHPGQDFTVRFHNAGRCPQEVDRWTAVGWEQWTDAGWAPVDIECSTGDVRTPTSPSAVCDSIYAPTLVAPGGDFALTRRVPPSLSPGRYRLKITSRPYSGSPTTEHEVDVM
jgi:hypothetical protein